MVPPYPPYRYPATYMLYPSYQAYEQCIPYMPVQYSGFTTQCLMSQDLALNVAPNLSPNVT